MAARKTQPKEAEEHAEIYLHPALFAPTRADRLRETARRATEIAEATALGLGGMLLLLVAMYILYLAKSALGIDLFPGHRLEDFVPLPGYGRW